MVPMERNFGTLIRVICTALYIIAGFRMAQDQRPCAASLVDIN